MSQSTGASSSWAPGWLLEVPAGWRARRTLAGASSGAASTSSVLRAWQTQGEWSRLAEKGSARFRCRICGTGGMANAAQAAHLGAFLGTRIVIWRGMPAVPAKS